MDYVSGIVTGIVIEAGKLLCRHVGQPIRHVLKFKSNVQKLQEQEKKLTKKKESVLRDVEEARSREDTIKAEVQEWLNKVDEFTKRLDSVTNQENKQCFKGCPNLKTRFADSKEAVELVKECDPLLAQGNFASVYSKNHARELKQREKELTEKYEGVRHRVEEAEKQGDTIEAEVQGWLANVEDFTTRVKNITNEENKEAVELVNECDRLLTLGNFPRVSNRSLPPRTRSMYVKEDDAFDSRESVFKEVMETLKNTDVKATGVYGMGGVGKTTLVKKVYFHAKEDGLFKQVVMAEVTQNSDIIKIQEAIADDLGLVFTEKSERGRADRLHERLKKEKSVLVILDDVWKELKLDAIGIPVRTADQRDCKLLLTSRDQNVCKFMKTEKNIPIMPLSPDEALALFWKEVDDSEKHSLFGSIADKIVAKCAGLPIAISVIAKMLKHEDRAVWNDILDKWGNFKFSNREDLYHLIELSYNFLKNEDAKSLFLLCGLYPVGRSININDHLVRIVMGLGLFQKVNTLKEVRNKVYESIKDLKAKSLLLDSGRKNFIKVHDVIHMVAQEIASRDKLMFVQVVDGLEEELEKPTYENSRAIALHYVDARELPDQMPEFPRLELVTITDSPSRIPDRFFDRMEGLKVLSMDTASLSAPLGCLMNLKTLCLDFCCLGDISAIGELKKLQVLSFSGSDIKKLPEKIGELTRLKLLDLEHCSQLEVIPPNVLSKLERLEELYIGDSFVEWDVQNNASLTELKQLTRLTILSIHVMDAQIIPQDLFLEKLENYMIVVGEGWPRNWNFSWQNPRTLKLKISNGKEFGVKKLLKKTKELYLDNLNGFNNTHPDLGGEGFPDLRSLDVQNDPHISRIVKLTEGYDGCSTYPRLESLLLHNLINLEKICHGELRAETFANLKTINVKECVALTHLIPLSTTRAFLHLQEIEVADCTNLKEIVGKEMQDNNIAVSEIVFTELHTLTLYDLPKLMSFGPSTSLTCGEIFQEDDDSMILFGRKVSFPSVKNLTLWRLNIRNIWCNQPPSSYSFGETLRSLKVTRCPHLKFLCTISVASSLKHLEELEIKDCVMMKELISEGAEKGPATDKTLFPKLHTLLLHDLPKIKMFCSFSGHAIKLASLSQLTVRDCPNMQKFVSNPVSISMTPNLKPEEMNAEENRHADTIPLFDEKIKVPALEYLKLSSVNDLEGLCAMSVALSLVHLEELEIEDCAKMKEIITEVAEKDLSTDETIFPKLSCLSLKSLPELKTFCNFSGHAIKLASLSQLTISNCPNMQNFVSNPVSISLTPSLKLEEMNPEENLHADAIPLFDEKISLPHLKLLSITSMGHLRRLWHNLICTDSFYSLEMLEIWYCEKLCNVFPHVVLNRLKRLEVLSIQYCRSLEEIFDVPEGSSSMEENTISRVIFPLLTELRLSFLGKLKSFYHGLHISEWPSLKELTVKFCDNVEIFGSEYQSLCKEKQSVPQPLFIVDKDAFPRLEKLRLWNNNNLKEIWHGGGIISKTLMFWGKTNIIKFPHYLLATDTLDIPSGYFKQIGGGSDNTFTAALRELRTLRVYGGDDDDDDDSLDKYFESTDSLACLVSSWVSFQNLTNLKIIGGCRGFRYLLTYSTAISLQHLTLLKISHCEMIEAIIMHPTDEVNDKIVFSQLKYLELYNLESLTSFYSGSHTFEFPSLEEMIVDTCPNMKVFSEGDSITPVLQSIQLDYCDDDDKWRLEGDVNNTIQKMFKEMVGFKSLYELRLSKFPRLKEIWHGQIPFSLFSRLCHLTVDKCADMSSAIPLNLLPCLKSLYGLTIEDCDSLEEVIHVERLDADATMSDIGNDVRDDDITISEIVFTELSTLTLKLLPKLMNFGPTAISTTLENIQEGDLEDLKSLFDNKVSFPSLKNLTLSSLNIPSIWCNKLPSSYSFGETLTSLDVEDCPHLKFLFSSSMVNGLQQLEKLKVANCESMEVIINKEGSTGENNFNNISSFDGKVCDSVEEIFDVPEGSSSMEGNTIRMIIFPKLTQLSLSGLRKLKSFYNGLHISKWPSLKELTVVCCDKVEIFGSKYQSFHEEKQSVPQPLFIVNEAAFPRLEDLVLEWNDNMKEIWHGGGIISKNLWFVGEINIIKFPHYLLATDTMDITSGYFKQIGGGSDNTFTAALRQLRTLTVDDVDDSLDEYFESSDSLACLTSSWMSFQNLTNLKIINVYSGFRYLLPYSTATSLQHLTRLEISYCKKAEVIIMPPTNEVNDKIVFSQLKYLELQNLESLTSFYSGNHTLEFPSLEEMIANRCPNMKVFSEGDSITPELQSIQLEQYDKWRLEGDVNSTIRKMFKEMVGFKGLEELRLSKFPHLKELWHGQIPFSLFGELGHLTVDKCADMSSAIPLKLLPCLESLRRLTIEDCDSLEEVIHMEGLDVDDQSLLLPELTRIRLIELPRLRNVWSKHPLEILGFTNLVHLSISKCNSLQYIFTTNIILGLKQLEKVKIRDCAMVETIITEDREKDAAMSDIVVPRLKFIILESLPRLTCFHSRSNVLECSSLKTMRINDRPQMKTFVSTSTEDLDLQDTPLFNEKVAFPNLEKLKLSKLPMVEHLWSKPCIQCLATIEISECLNLKSLVPYSASLQSLTTLKVSQCDGLTSLVTLSTAKSLEQLTRINVANCKIMREIITHIHTGDEENGRVVLAKLKCIELHCLPNISGFYLGDYTIELPALEQVVVRQCQKMNKFSKGALSTPKLKRVQRTKDEEEGCWKNNLNTIVQLLFEETNVQSQKED